MARFRIDLVIVVSLVGLILACYWPVGGHTFVEFDDTDYIVFNAPVRSGLSWEGVVWAFSDAHSANWHPLTWLSHMLDCSLFGLKAGRHHLTALAFHVANSVLFYLALRALIAVGQMNAAIAAEAPVAPARGRGRGAGRNARQPQSIETAWCCGLVAALFAVHPQHAESVAWLAERKDVLSAFFWMLTLLAYAWYAARPASWGRYLLVALFLSLGLMSKPMVVTLPAVLLLLDYWPLGRWPIGTAFPSRRWLPPWPLVREKLLFVGLVATSSVITFVAQRAGGAVVTTTGLSYWHRFSNALWSYFDYLVQMFWPLNLCFFYPHPTAFRQDMDNNYTLLAGVSLLSVSVAVLALHRARPFLLVGWLWYLGTLVPVIGIVQVGDQARADRYTYLPSIGAYIVLVFGAAVLWDWLRGRVSRPAANFVATAGTAALLAVLCVLTFRQQATWHDTTALATNGLRVTGENNYMCYFMLGVTLERQGEFEEALDRYRTSLKYNDRSPLTLHNAARLLLERKLPAEAEVVCRKLIKLRPDLANAKVLLGAALEDQKKFSEAQAVLEDLTKDPTGAVEGYAALAILLGNNNRAVEGIKLLDEADRLYGDRTELQMSRGCLLRQLGRYEEAAVMLEASVRRAKDPVKALTFLGDVRLKQGRIDEVIKIYKRMSVESPFNMKPPLALAMLLDQNGRSAEAVAELRVFLQRFPGHANASNNLAWILATDEDPKIRNGPLAVMLIEAALRAPGNRTWELLDTAAAAYAAVGRYPDAIRAVREAIGLAKNAGLLEVARDVETRLALYEAGRPYRRPKPTPEAAAAAPAPAL